MSRRSEGFFNVSGGKFADFETEGALNVPLSDRLATRFSFATGRHDGLISNFAGPDANSQNQYAARWQLLDKISDAGDALLKLYYLRNLDEVSPSYAWGASCNVNGLLAPGHKADINIIDFDALTLRRPEVVTDGRIRPSVHRRSRGLVCRPSVSSPVSTS